MRLTGKGVWGPPADHDECIRVLRRAVELGVNFIDTADSYGPALLGGIDPRSAASIRRTGHRHQGGPAAHRPRRLDPARLPALPAPGGRDEPAPARRRTIDLFQLHRIDDKFPLEDQLGELAALQQEGKIRHIGLSEITVEQLQQPKKSPQSSPSRTCTT